MKTELQVVNQKKPAIESSFLKVVMKNMTVRLTVIILIISTFSYFYFEQNIKDQLKNQIQTYTDTKARNESLYYGSLQDDLTLIQNSFQQKLRQSQPIFSINDLGATKGFFVTLTVTVFPSIEYSPSTPPPANSPLDESPLNLCPALSVSDLTLASDWSTLVT